MYKKSIKITFLCLFTVFITTNVLPTGDTPLIDAIKSYYDRTPLCKKNAQIYLTNVESAIKTIKNNMYVKEYVAQKDSKKLDALNYTFQINDFEVFLKVFLLLLPHIENLQEKLNEQIKLTCNYNKQANINKIALLIYLGAKCNLIDPDDPESQRFIINIGTNFPTLKLEEIHRNMLVMKIWYFYQQQLICEIAQSNELTDEQQQIGQLPKRKESIQIRIDSQRTLTF